MHTKRYTLPEERPCPFSLLCDSLLLFAGSEKEKVEPAMGVAEGVGVEGGVPSGVVPDSCDLLADHVGSLLMYFTLPCHNP